MVYITAQSNHVTPPFGFNFPTLSGKITNHSHFGDSVGSARLPNHLIVPFGSNSPILSCNVISGLEIDSDKTFLRVI